MCLTSANSSLSTLFFYNLVLISYYRIEHKLVKLKMKNKNSNSLKVRKSQFVGLVY